MWAICLNEFKSLFKSIKSIIIMIIIFWVSYKVAELIENAPADVIRDLGLGDNPNEAGIAVIVFLFGFLIISGLSHDMINREVNSRTIRFLVTKTSHTKIIVGKFLGVWLFWIICMTASFLLVMMVSRTFFWLGAVECMAFLAAAIALNLLFSVIFSKPAMSIFFGIVFALFFPALSFWAINSENVMISSFKYVTPYYYADLGSYFILIDLIYALTVLFGAIVLFKRRDL
ncbi:ABC transporter permease subunit [Bacillus swezeyi]|uniref:ABC transporter permease subunit n=1 Tax=Bacillus swezeyi TaxID=1925020 RepID=UPI003F8976E6